MPRYPPPLFFCEPWQEAGHEKIYDQFSLRQMSPLIADFKFIAWTVGKNQKLQGNLSILQSEVQRGILQSYIA